MEIIVQPLASIDALHIQSGQTVSQWGEEDKSIDGERQNDQGRDPSRNDRPAAHALLGSDKATQAAVRLGLARGVILGRRRGGRVQRLQVEDEFDQCTRHHGRSQVRWQVMVEEALTAHQPEGEVVSSPAQEQESGAVIQARAGSRTPD